MTQKKSYKQVQKHIQKKTNMRRSAKSVQPKPPKIKRAPRMQKDTSTKWGIIR